MEVSELIYAQYPTKPVDCPVCKQKIKPHESKINLADDLSDADNMNWHHLGCSYLVKDKPKEEVVRVFDTGANRDVDNDKLDYEGFLSPRVIKRYAEYMHENRFLKDGSMRDSDNWQKGMPYDVYMKSAFRHFMDWWEEHRDIESREGIELALCGLMFNTMGYLHEYLKEHDHA